MVADEQLPFGVSRHERRMKSRFHREAPFRLTGREGVLCRGLERSELNAAARFLLELDLSQVEGGTDCALDRVAPACRRAFPGENNISAGQARSLPCGARADFINDNSLVRRVDIIALCDGGG